MEDFAPAIRFDSEDDHLRHLARLACMAASVLVPDGSLQAFDNTIEDYRRYALHYPDYHAAYEGLDPRTLRRDKQAVRQVLLRFRGPEGTPSDAAGGSAVRGAAGVHDRDGR